jgi:lipopolysaccharide transport system ATP-binding protein
MSKREIASKFDEILAFAGLEDFIDTPVKRYSSGMYARLGFSVAAHVNPDVLIVDEVLSVGDHAFQKRCMDKMREVIRNGATVLFVSHNLTAVTEFCTRCMLLQRGQTTAMGSAEEVMRKYLGESQGGRTTDNSQEVVISKITVRNQNGECQRFESGEKAYVDVEITARQRCEKLSVSLYLTDPADNMIVDTSTERLGHGRFDLEAGESFRCTFELDLNLVSGTFHVSSLIYRYDIRKEFDRLLRASTLFVSYRNDVRGYANCFPRVINSEILPAAQEKKSEESRAAFLEK